MKCRKCGSTDRVPNGPGKTRCRVCKNAARRKSTPGQVMVADTFDKLDERKRQRAERERAKRNPDAHSHGAPEGYLLRGVSTLERADGSVALRWVKTAKDTEDRIAAILDVFEEMAERIPTAAVIDPPAYADDDLMCVYPMGDPHFGMYAWAPECGQDFDLAIAERELLGAVDHLVSRAPAAGTAVLLNLGDFFHANDAKARTPKSGHVLDVDTRWPRVFRTGVRTCVAAIERLLERHARVIWRGEPGNHDPEAAFALSVALEQRFVDNPRVTIDLSPGKYWFHRHGRCYIASTHGDTCSSKELAEAMASDRPDLWGESWYRHGYRGHLHHSSTVEHMNTIVETFRTLAARDAHAASTARYRSGRDMRCHVWHATEGLIEQNIVNIRKVQSNATP